MAHRVWTNKDAGVVERERRDVSVKRFGFAIHKQVTFHVGNIESANDSVVLLQVLSFQLGIQAERQDRHRDAGVKSHPKVSEGAHFHPHGNNQRQHAREADQ